MRPKSSSPKTRLTLEVATEVRERMEILKDRTGAESITEVIRRAISIYAEILNRTEGGGELVCRDQNGKERILVLV